MKRVPLILCIGGHDPTGGAGIQADIETVCALGAQAVSLVTCLTAQDTRDVRAVWPTPPDSFSRQADTLLRDIRPDAIKLGLIASTALIAPLTELLRAFGGPVVLDPVLSAGGGFDLAGDDLAGAIREHLLPLTTLATPNRHEARRLAGLAHAEGAASALLCSGIDAVLLTGADETDGTRVVNQLYTAGGVTDFSWPRLPGSYHGSGCTLASACATRLAFGDDITPAVDAAQGFAARALEAAVQRGAGQALPWRCA